MGGIFSRLCRCRFGTKQDKTQHHRSSRSPINQVLREDTVDEYTIDSTQKYKESMKIEDVKPRQSQSIIIHEEGSLLADSITISSHTSDVTLLTVSDNEADTSFQTVVSEDISQSVVCRVVIRHMSQGQMAEDEGAGRQVDSDSKSKGQCRTLEALEGPTSCRTLEELELGPKSPLIESHLTPRDMHVHVHQLDNLQQASPYAPKGSPRLLSKTVHRPFIQPRRTKWTLSRRSTGFVRRKRLNDIARIYTNPIVKRKQITSTPTGATTDYNPSTAQQHETVTGSDRSTRDVTKSSCAKRKLKQRVISTAYGSIRVSPTKKAKTARLPCYSPIKARQSAKRDQNKTKKRTSTAPSDKRRVSASLFTKRYGGTSTFYKSPLGAAPSRALQEGTSFYNFRMEANRQNKIHIDLICSTRNKR